MVRAGLLERQVVTLSSWTPLEVMFNPSLWPAGN